MDIFEGEQYNEKGSKFFGFFAPVESLEQFKSFMKEIEQKHRRSSHYLYAYVINEKTLLEPIYREKYSNAGEPSGCGNAVLNLLKHNKVASGALIVVRYFGGVLLGSGNLMRAYAVAGKAAMAAYKNTVHDV